MMMIDDGDGDEEEMRAVASGHQSQVLGGACFDNEDD